MFSCWIVAAAGCDVSLFTVISRTGVEHAERLAGAGAAIDRVADRKLISSPAARWMYDPSATGELRRLLSVA
jgi:hypothetical protein